MTTEFRFIFKLIEQFYADLMFESIQRNKKGVQIGEHASGVLETRAWVAGDADLPLTKFHDVCNKFFDRIRALEDNKLPNSYFSALVLAH